MISTNLWNKLPGESEFIPTLEYYPAENKTTDATIVILPGGGYSGRAQHEGKGYAEFLNELGMDAFVCQYRVSPDRHPLPLLDARRAVQTVRFRAEELDINPSKIGIMGSSAGGHLSATLCNITEEYPDVLTEKDEIDELPYLPDFQVLCYPVISIEKEFGHTGSGTNLFGDSSFDNPERAELSIQKHINPNAPSAFVWHTLTDQAVPVENSLSYIRALHENGIEAELHIMPYGVHGLGLAQNDPHISTWTQSFVNWLRYKGFIK